MSLRSTSVKMIRDPGIGARGSAGRRGHWRIGRREDVLVKSMPHRLTFKVLFVWVLGAVAVRCLKAPNPFITSSSSLTIKKNVTFKRMLLETMVI
jgi:hypothetical protein